MLRIELQGGPLDGEVVTISVQFDTEDGVPPYYDQFIEVLRPDPYQGMTARLRGWTNDYVPIGGHWHRWVRRMGPINPTYYDYQGILNPDGTSAKEQTDDQQDY
jgi:hypothetical protein